MVMVNESLILKSILESFELSSGLEIMYISKNNMVNLESYCNKSSLSSSEIKFTLNHVNELQNYINSKMIQFLHLHTGKEICIVYINLDNTINHYFILGPFSSNKDDIKTTYTYRARHCIKYLIELLLLIIDEKLSNYLNFPHKILSLNVRKTIEYVNLNYSEQITIDTISKMLNIHKCYFCNLFKKETNMTFSNFLCKFRIDKSKNLLINSSMSIIDIAISVGFNNSSYYSMMFKKFTDLTPIEFRKSLCIYNSLHKNKRD